MKEFFNPEQTRSLYPEIATVYQSVFAGEPWFEVSKCADDAETKRCVGGFSALAVGQTCEMCGNCPIKNAYEQKELVAQFEEIARTRPTAWYLERNEKGLTLAAIAWVRTPLEIVSEKYPDSPKMAEWIKSILGQKKIIWLDEVFADRSKKPSGNLSNFRKMCMGFSDTLGYETIAFRTINDRMVSVTKRDFPYTNKIFRRGSQVPDRRDFVVISTENLWVF